DNFRATFDLVQDRALQRGIDIRQKDVLGGLVGLGQARFEFREDIQFRGESRALVHVFVVTSGPEKCFAGGTFESLGVHAAAVKNGRVFVGKVVPYDSDEIDVGEEACGDGKICCRTAQH